MLQLPRRSIRTFALVVLLSVLSLSLLPSSLAGDYCDYSGGCGGDYCSCGTCRCHGNGYSTCDGCGTTGGAIAGIVVAVFIAVAIALCLLSLCYRRRYAQRYAGQTYNTGVVTTAIPMQAMPVGYPQQQPMQAIPVQYAQYQPQQYGQPYGQYGAPAYAQTPMGGGQPIHASPPASHPPAYTTYPSAPGGEGQPHGSYPSTAGEYSGERAI